VEGVEQLTADELVRAKRVRNYMCGSDAEISECGRYRYTLTRTWDLSLPTMTFCGLNPSTADAREDDPTIRRMLGFARREGCGQLVVVNAYAWRATEPFELWRAYARGYNVVGPRNDLILAQEASLSDRFVVAWGASCPGPIVKHLRTMLLDLGVSLWCLGLTRGGAPCHPLYLPAITLLQSW
jgi:hypothetical protein